MKPILLIHGYSSEGKETPVAKIYGTLPDELRKTLGTENVKELDLSRWISLSDGISLDDVSLAMDRALNTEYPELLNSGFHVIIHSTGALVARNWIKKFSPKPSPVNTLIHLAGANFGSGLAHIGKGQMARWGRFLTIGTGSGFRILNELEFGSWKTLDLHLHFLNEGTRMLQDYQVQEYCMIGSQVPELFRFAPIRYVKEDSSDCTVRTSAGNLNFNYVRIVPNPKSLTDNQLKRLVSRRLNGKPVSGNQYQIETISVAGEKDRPGIPFAIPYEIAHSGDEIGIVSGEKNRRDIQALIKIALNTPRDPAAYAKAEKKFSETRKATFQKAAKLKSRLTEWNPQSQYEGHAQIIFRIRDQDGLPVEHFDVFLHSETAENSLGAMIEDKHCNKNDKGTITFYLRTQQFNKRNGTWKERLDNVIPLDIEITGEEPLSDRISYVPLSIHLNPDQIRSVVKSFQTTIIDITLTRLPSSQVFEITRK
ncbi:MAG: hypothetical protein AB7E95_08855 [Kiritimatiellales bacterium]